MVNVSYRYRLFIDAGIIRHVRGNHEKLARVAGWLRHLGHSLYIEDEQGMQIQI